MGREEMGTQLNTSSCGPGIELRIDKLEIIALFVPRGEYIGDNPLILANNIREFSLSTPPMRCTYNVARDIISH